MAIDERPNKRTKGRDIGVGNYNLSRHKLGEKVEKKMNQREAK